MWFLKPSYEGLKEKKPTENPGEDPVEEMQAEGTEEIIMSFISSYLH